MELQVEVRPEYYSDEINKMLALKKKLTATFAKRIRTWSQRETGRASQH